MIKASQPSAGISLAEERRSRLALDTPAYHSPDMLKLSLPFHSTRRLAAESWREASPGQHNESSVITTAAATNRVSAFNYLLDCGCLDFLRLHGTETAGRLRAAGQQILAAGLEPTNARFAKGRLENPELGVPLRSGGELRLPVGLLDSLAEDNQKTHNLSRHRSHLYPSEGLRQPVAQKSNNSYKRDWGLLPDSARAPFREDIYEFAIALANLNESEFKLLDNACEAMQPAVMAGLKALARQISPDYQSWFANTQLVEVYGWRCRFQGQAPSGALIQNPSQLPSQPEYALTQLSKPARFMAMHMAIGSLEYLRALGQEALLCMTELGKHLNAADPKDHSIVSSLQERPLRALELKNGLSLHVAPDLLDFGAKQNHELWRAGLCLSRVMPENELHAAPRVEDVDFELSAERQQNPNRLTVLAQAKWLAKLAAADPKRYQTLIQSAAQGNPYGLHLAFATVQGSKR